MKRVFGLMLAVVFCLLLLSGCQKKEEASVSLENFLLDTPIELTLYGADADEAVLHAAMKEISRLENLLSVEKEGSDMQRLAAAAGQDWVDISPECEAVLRRAQEIWALSDGHFDITTGPLIDLWAIGDGGHYPTEEERQAAMAKISSEKLLVEDGRAFLTEPGMKANLGAIAKGYIADQIKLFLQDAGVTHAQINLGRNLLFIGGHTDDSPFLVGVQSPWDAQGEVSLAVQVKDMSVVTAGTNERYFEYEGKRYHHILDPFTGFPADLGVASVTIISQESVMGDALSTTCLLLGPEAGLARIEQMPGIEALYLMDDGRQIMSSGFASYLYPLS